MSNLKRFQNALADHDGALISSELNQRYLSDFPFSDGYILVTKNNAFLLTDSRYIEAARATVTELEVVLPNVGMLDTLRSLVSELGLKKLAIEESSMTVASFDNLKKSFDNCSLSGGASKILTELRSVKTSEELDRIEKAQAITDAAFDHILGYINPERTELDVALELEFFMRSHGADGIAFDTIAVSGSASSLPHGVPSNVKLRRGFLTMDFGAKYKGYCSDMTRTVVIGKADDDMKKLYNTVLSAQKKALDGICDGILCKDADALARDVIREGGYGQNFGHSLGHGVGLFIHESPSLSPRAAETSRLTRGNVVTVEPGIYIEGKYGCRIEDMIAIGHDGKVRNFTKSSKALIEI